MVLITLCFYLFVWKNEFRNKIMFLLICLKEGIRNKIINETSDKIKKTATYF